MIMKKLNIGNRKEYDVLVLDGTSDSVYKVVALLKSNAKHDPEPFVVAIGYDLTDGIWRSGWYYETLEQAKRSFYLHTLGIEL